MDVLKESPIWVTPVYAIERTDPLMGGEFVINNVQARQLAWRTQYLRALLAMDHQPDGSHLLCEHHVARLAAIAESKLRLSVPTSRIRVEIDKLRSSCRALNRDWTASPEPWAPLLGQSMTL